MNRIQIIFSTMCLLVVPALYAQEPADEPKPPRHEEARPESNRDAAPPARQNDAQPPRQEEAKPRHEEARPPNQQNERNQNERNPKTENVRPERDQARPAREEDGHAQQTSHARPAGKSARIPDEKFRASFGRPHTFVISRPVVVEGQPRFQYSGYWFEIVDPWPAEWAYTDDVYVDYIDGDYFLYDLVHPGVRIAVFVVT